MKGLGVAAERLDTQAPAPAGVAERRQIWMDRHGGPEVMTIRAAPVASPKPGEVRIRVHAIGLNFAEAMIRLGVMPNGPRLPAVLGWEVAGEVETGGAQLQPGDRVFALTEWGGYADSVCVPEAHVYRLPAGWSYEAGAAFPVAYLLSYQLLYIMGSARPGMRVLVHGAAGAVGQAAVQVARHLGCEVYGTASPGKHEVVRKLGATPIDRGADFVAAVRQLTGGRGVDIALDAIGGAHWKRSFEALAPTGRLLAYGMHEPVTSSGQRSIFKMVKSFLSAPRFSPIGLLDAGKGVIGANLGHLFSDPELRTCRAWLTELLEWAAAGRIQPGVGATYPFERVAEAHADMQAGRTTGKAVLTVGRGLR